MSAGNCWWVRNRERELACPLWTSPAWKMQARDAWIGWSDEGITGIAPSAYR